MSSGRRASRRKMTEHLPTKPATPKRTVNPASRINLGSRRQSSPSDSSDDWDEKRPVPAFERRDAFDDPGVPAEFARFAQQSVESYD